ncbi:DMT family transporter, partial [Cupriavidus sp. UBA2526]|uniref:DMT family transporter n=1 Tax=Cupriavidus sp. UBA2526 TaxID=1946398 RepID=UPI00257FBC8C
AGVNAIATTTVICTAAALQPPQFLASAGGWLALVAIALVSTVLAILTFFAGLQRLGASKASMLSTLEPVVTVVLAAVLLGEHIGPTQAVGGGLILAGVLWLTRRASGTPPLKTSDERN